MPLKDNWFREHKPLDIVNKVAEITLAAISEWTEEELIRVGWTGNPIIDILYSLTSAGVWIARTDPYGIVTTSMTGTQQNLLSSLNYGASAPTIGNGASGSSNAHHRRIAQIALTEAGGAIAETVIIPGIASYKAIAILRKLYYPEGSTDASHTLLITSEAGGAITGPGAIVQAGTAFQFTMIGAGDKGIYSEGVLVYNTTADKDIILALTDLTTDGTHHTYYLEVEYWYEA